MSKYSTLPDIDSAPDFYETPDLPADSLNEGGDDSDSELQQQSRTGANAGGSENIDVGRLDTAEARKRFGEGSGAGRELPARRLPSRRLPSTSTYSVLSNRYPSNGVEEVQEKETTLERLRRLRSEVQDLEDDVRAEKEIQDAQEGPEVVAGGSKRKGVTPGVILQQLQILRGDLGALKLDEVTLEGQGSNVGGLEKKLKDSSSLLSRLGTSTAPETTSGPPTPPPKSTVPPVSSSELEKRLAEMERVIGVSEADVDETNALSPPLVQTLGRLDHLLTLLTQPRHLDSISRRVKVLVSDLERLHESRRKLGDTRPLNVALSGGMTVAVVGTVEPVRSNLSASMAPSASSSSAPPSDSIAPDTLQKIDALFALLPRIDPLLPLTPKLLTRLRSLANVHSVAATFADTLAVLKAETERLGEGEKDLQEMLAGLEGSMAGNETKVKGNLDALDERIAGLVARLDQIGL